MQPESARSYAPSALPPVTARVLAFVAILVGGLCGGLIGYSISDLQCGTTETKIVVGQGAPGATTTTSVDRPGRSGGDCTAWNGGSGLLGAVIGAGGTGVVAVLVLRAMAEWRRDLDVDLEQLPDDPAGSAP